MTGQNLGKTEVFTCPNSSCGKVFEKPLKAVNIQLSNGSAYDCCPYCLTEIPKKEEIEPEEEIEVVQAEKEPAPEPPSSCPFHMGYLSERTSKEAIPDKCMLCKDIVTCMLNNLNQ